VSGEELSITSLDRIVSMRTMTLRVCRLNHHPRPALRYGSKHTSGKFDQISTWLRSRQGSAWLGNHPSNGWPWGHAADFHADHLADL